MIALIWSLSVSLQVWLMIYVALLDDLKSNILKALFVMQILSCLFDCVNLTYLSKPISTKNDKIVKATLFFAFKITIIIAILLSVINKTIVNANKDKTTEIAFFVSIALFIASKAFLAIKNQKYLKHVRSYSTLV
jgi:hypothetical protein